MSGKSKTRYPDGMTKEQYDQNTANIASQQASNDKQVSDMMAYTKRMSAASTAQSAALRAVNEEMTSAMTGAQKTITGYEGQERRRLFEAKKGEGQVDASDTAISSGEYEKAKKLLQGGTGAWDAKREAAMRAGGGTCPITGQSLAPGEVVSPKGEAILQNVQTQTGGSTGAVKATGNTLGSSMFDYKNDKRWNDTGL